MRLIITLFYVALIITGVAFSVLNSQLVELNLYIRTVSIPVSFLLVLTFVTGLLCGLLFFVWRYVRLKFAYGRLRDQLTMSEKEIKNLRSIPLQDQH